MQHRERLVLEFWDRSKELSIKNKKYRNFVGKFFPMLLKYDLGNGDLTTASLIKKNKNIYAAIIAREDGILAGIDEFKSFNKDLRIRLLKNDGDQIKKDDILVEVNGSARKILGRERVSLNLLQRMSGIATLTDNLSKKLDNIRIAATRKTLWGGIDKKAVSVGSGLTHRLNLSDGLIIKDNHLKLLNYDIEKALKLAKNRQKYVEIEVEDKKQALIAAKAIKKLIGNGAKNLFAIMFDKMPPEEIKAIIMELKKQDLYNNILFEASGGINPKNLAGYAGCSVDVISMGCITNSAKALDMSMEIIK